jgi:hypothetical protein
MLMNLNYLLFIPPPPDIEDTICKWDEVFNVTYLDVENEFEYDCHSSFYHWIVDFHKRELDYLLLIPVMDDIDEMKCKREYMWNNQNMEVKYEQLTKLNRVNIPKSPEIKELGKLEGGLLFHSKKSFSDFTRWKLVSRVGFLSKRKLKFIWNCFAGEPISKEDKLIVLLNKIKDLLLCRAIIDKWEIIFLDPLAPDDVSDRIKTWLKKKLKPRIKVKGSLSSTILYDFIDTLSPRNFLLLNSTIFVVPGQDGLLCIDEGVKENTQQSANPTVESCTYFKSVYGKFEVSPQDRHLYKQIIGTWISVNFWNFQLWLYKALKNVCGRTPDLFLWDSILQWLIWKAKPRLKLELDPSIIVTNDDRNLFIPDMIGDLSYDLGDVLCYCKNEMTSFIVYWLHTQQPENPTVEFMISLGWLRKSLVRASLWIMQFAEHLPCYMINFAAHRDIMIVFMLFSYNYEKVRELCLRVFNCKILRDFIFRWLIMIVILNLIFSTIIIERSSQFCLYLLFQMCITTNLSLEEWTDDEIQNWSEEVIKVGRTAYRASTEAVIPLQTKGNVSTPTFNDDEVEEVGYCFWNPIVGDASDG